MVLPLLAAGIGFAYAGGRLATNVAYWHDYKKNTGFYPKYAFLRGPGSSVGYGSRAFSELKKL